MRRGVLACALLLLLPGLAWGQASMQTRGLVLQNAGSSVGQVHTLNCTGSGVTCSRSGAVGTINVPGAVGASWTQITVDWATCGASNPGWTCKTTVTDATVTATSKLIFQQDGAAQAGIKSADENEMDLIACRATPAAGSFTLYCTSKEGQAIGKYLIDYTAAS